eukprot:XP_002257980.1 hypothetical protein, conserved in Plasmodium species [Plasmodium knowlesi strain H]
MGFQSAIEESNDITNGMENERRKNGHQKGYKNSHQKGDQKGGQEGDQKMGQKNGQKNDQKGGQKNGQKRDKKDGQKNDRQDDHTNEEKVAQEMKATSRQNHRMNPLGGSTRRIRNEKYSTEKTKKHYLDNVDKTLQKRNIDCVSYVYKNMNDETTSKTAANSVKFGGGESRVDVVRKMLLFEKRPKKNVTIGANRSSAATGDDCPCSKEDENVQSIIYSTFINTKLRQTQNHATETISKPQKGKLAKQAPGSGGKDKKGNYTSSGQRFYAKQSQVNPDGIKQSVDAYRQNLISVVKKIVCTDKSQQITESNEELRNLQNDGTFFYEKIISDREKKKKVNYTQTSTLYQEEEIKSFAKYMAKQIVNEATIQLTYEENVKAMEQKEKTVQLNHQQNVQTYSHLTNFQRDNLEVMADGTQLSRCLHIFSKINTFGLSGSLINSLLRKNVQEVKEQNSRSQIEWNNQVTKHLLKNTIAFIATEKIVSYIAEELIEDCILNFFRMDKRDSDILINNMEDHNISLYDRRRMESGHFNFVLSNDNLNVNIPVRVKKHMNLEDIVIMIKNHIKKKQTFLLKEYKLDFLCIRDGTRDITSIHDLLSSEANHFTICLNKKEGEAIPTP